MNKLGINIMADMALRKQSAFIPYLDVESDYIRKYLVYVCDPEETIVIGCFTKFDDAVACCKMYWRTSAVKCLTRQLDLGQPIGCYRDPTNVSEAEIIKKMVSFKNSAINVVIV